MEEAAVEDDSSNLYFFFVRRFSAIPLPLRVPGTKNLKEFTEFS